ncbi:MAG: methyltransferase domain-containing protein [Bacteroidia bacterium]
MYQILKKIFKTLLPSSLLISQEERFRKVLTWFYQGNQRECNICQAKLAKFVLSEKGDLLCPNCGSLGRNRRLLTLLQAEPLAGKRMLEFSPSRCLFRYWKKQQALTYIATDFENEFLADVKWDITNLPTDVPPFDYIVCYHILEHITDDEKAMQNLYRMVKPTGKIFIQTPFKAGEIYEDVRIQSPEQRLAHFGQEDHVRIYSVEGLKQRLTQQGFQVEVLHFQETDDNYRGFGTEEFVLVARV